MWGVGSGFQRLRLFGFHDWQPLIGGQGISGQTTDIQIHANHMVHIRNKMNTLLSQYTGQPLETITRDTERDNYMTAQQAKEYGLIDDILYKH